jgi:hypothetical protein
MNTDWHFPVMIIAALFVFFFIIRIILPRNEFKQKFRQILLLSLIVVVFGMLFGKYGATYGLPWWVYYPIPMLITVFLPPVVLKLNARKTIVYLLLSFLSAPFIHAFFSFFIGWKEYMPFWEIPFVGDLMR